MGWSGPGSSRYQDFSKAGVVTPPGFSEAAAADYRAAAEKLLISYHQIHARAKTHLADKLPRPAEMKPEVYDRNITARAFDVARYVLFFGIPTGVGQVTSIRTARMADPAVEGVGICGGSRTGGRDCGGLFESSRLPLGREIRDGAGGANARAACGCG